VFVVVDILVKMSAPNICRRCKKKRSPDETPETLKYRTCKPCREIERKKKRLKKLAKLGGDQGENAEVGASNVLTGSNSVHDHSNAQLNVSDARQESLNAKIINIANQASMHSQQQTYERQTPQLAQHQQQHHHHLQHQPHEHKPEVEKEIPIDESLLKEGQAPEESTTLPPIRSENIQHHHQQQQQHHQVHQQQPQQHQQEIGEQSHQQQAGGDQRVDDATSVAVAAVGSTEGSGTGVVGATTTTSSTNSGGVDSQDNKSKNGDFSNDTKNIFAALQNAEKMINSSENTTTTNSNSENKSPNADYCLYCGVLRDVNDNGRYKLCGNCVDNPSESNVLSDFNEYLNRIENGKVFDIKNLIFLKKFGNDGQDIEDIPIFKIDDQTDQTDHTDQSSSNNNLNLIMESISTKFIQPIITASGFKFSKGSSNLSAKPFPKAIKVLYKCKQDIKTTQRSSNNNNTTNITDHPLQQQYHNHTHQSQSPSSPSTVNNRKMKSEDCNSNMYVSYDLYGRTLNIKYNHNTHKTYLEKLYSDELINEVKRLIEMFGGNDLELIFDKLTSPSYSTSDRVKMEITDLKKPNFTRDFANLL